MTIPLLQAWYGLCKTRLVKTSCLKYYVCFRCSTSPRYIDRYIGYVIFFSPLTDNAVPQSWRCTAIAYSVSPEDLNPTTNPLDPKGHRFHGNPLLPAFHLQCIVECGIGQLSSWFLFVRSWVLWYFRLIWFTDLSSTSFRVFQKLKNISANGDTLIY